MSAGCEAVEDLIEDIGLALDAVGRADGSLPQALVTATMKAMQYWINEPLAIVSRPWGDERLDDEMAALREAGIDVLVSMLEEGEAVRLGLEDEGNAARRAGLIFENFPIRDRGVPADKQLFDEFLEGLWRDTPLRWATGWRALLRLYRTFHGHDGRSLLISIRSFAGEGFGRRFSAAA